MANNRMYLTCRGCGKQIFIGACLGSEYEIYDPKDYNSKDKTFKQLLNEFYKEHEYCGGDTDCSIDGKQFHNENQYKLDYETVYTYSKDGKEYVDGVSSWKNHIK